MSTSKKGLLIGLCLGIAFIVYNNFSGCHTSFGGPNGCHGMIQTYIAILAFIFFFIILVLLRQIPSLTNYSFLPEIILFALIIISFGLFGMLFGFIFDRIKKLILQNRHPE
jgi:hypothetical protein